MHPLLGIVMLDSQSPFTAQDGHLGIFLEIAYSLVNPTGILKIIVVLQQGNVFAVREPHGFIVGTVLVEVISPDQELVGASQRLGQPHGMLHAGAIVNDDNLQIPVLAQLRQDMTHLQAFIVRLNDDAHLRLVIIAFAEPCRIRLLRSSLRPL